MVDNSIKTVLFLFRQVYKMGPDYLPGLTKIFIHTIFIYEKLLVV